MENEDLLDHMLILSDACRHLRAKLEGGANEWDIAGGKLGYLCMSSGSSSGSGRCRMVIVGPPLADGEVPPSRISGLMAIVPPEVPLECTPLGRVCSGSVDLLRVAKRSWSY